MAIHSFDEAVAAKTKSILAAVIYKNILFWSEKNLLDKRNVHDGRVWVFNSVKAWGALFPYVSGRQIRTALEKLIQHDLLVTGSYNQAGYDRTLWYSALICQDSHDHLPLKSNGVDAEVKPIPVSKPDNKPVSNPICFNDHFEKLWIWVRNHTKGSKSATRHKKPSSFKLFTEILSKETSLSPTVLVRSVCLFYKSVKDKDQCCGLQVLLGPNDQRFREYMDKASAPVPQSSGDAELDRWTKHAALVAQLGKWPFGASTVPPKYRHLYDMKDEAVFPWTTKQRLEELKGNK